MEKLNIYVIILDLLVYDYNVKIMYILLKRKY